MKPKEDVIDLFAGAFSGPLFRAFWGLCAAYAGMSVSLEIARFGGGTFLPFPAPSLLGPYFLAAPLGWGYGLVIGWVVQLTLLVQWVFLVREDEGTAQRFWSIFLLSSVLFAPVLERFWSYLLWALALAFIWWCTHRVPATALAAWHRRRG